MKKILVYSVFIASVIIVTIFMIPESFYEKNLNSKQVELTINKNTNVLNETGFLTQVGWTRRPNYFIFNNSNIYPTSSRIFTKEFNKLRYKKWEALMFTSSKFLFLFAPYDVTYLAGYLLHYADLTDPKAEIQTTWIKSFTDRVTITDQCPVSCLVYDYKRIYKSSSIKYAKFYKSSENFMHLEVDYDDNDKTKFNLNVDLKRSEDADSLVTLNPISEDYSMFYYNIKQNGIKPSGTLFFNNKEYDLSEFLVSYDSGRGVWPIKSGWIWANGNGKTSNNEIIGINIGHGFIHPKAGQATEDCFYINNKLFKLPAMKTQRPKDPSKPWKFTVSDLTSNENLTGNTCHIEFRRIKHNWVGLNILVGKLSFNITYGQFVGVCKDISNKEYLFENVYGILEEKESVW